MKTNITNSYDDLDYLNIIEEALKYASEMFDLENETLSLVFVDNETIHKMNSQYRHKDYATDVLTFPDGEYHHLGDVIISIDKAKEQAESYSHSFKRELSFLTIHGILHCLGYDHQTKEEETEMMALTEEILSKANIVR